MANEHCMNTYQVDSSNRGVFWPEFRAVNFVASHFDMAFLPSILRTTFIRPN